MKKIWITVIISLLISFAVQAQSSQYAENADVDFTKVMDLSFDGKEEPNPQMRMAHNIYSDPDLSDTSGKFDGFLIDFKADFAPNNTYWALCNFNLDVSELALENTILDSAWAYCGLQHTENGSMALMSFWEIKYQNKDGEELLLTPTLIYPNYDGQGIFDGEGVGVQYLHPYEWEAGKWYRMFICSYPDLDSGNTFVDMWLRELDGGVWEKYCTYDTNLKNTCFCGSMSQFMENYWYENCNNVRSFEYRNIYVRDVSNGLWKSITKWNMSVDTYWDNKKGSFAFGSTDTCLWGTTCGYGEDQAHLGEDIHSFESIEPLSEPEFPS